MRPKIPGGPSTGQGSTSLQMFAWPSAVQLYQLQAWIMSPAKAAQLTVGVSLVGCGCCFIPQPQGKSGIECSLALALRHRNALHHHASRVFRFFCFSLPYVCLTWWHSCVPWRYCGFRGECWMTPLPNHNGAVRLVEPGQPDMV